MPGVDNQHFIRRDPRCLQRRSVQHARGFDQGDPLTSGRARTQGGQQQTEHTNATRQRVPGGSARQPWQKLHEGIGRPAGLRQQGIERRMTGGTPRSLDVMLGSTPDPRVGKEFLKRHRRFDPGSMAGA